MLDQSKAVWPTVKAYQNTWTHEIIPFKFGYGWSLQLQAGIDEFADLRKAKEMIDSGLHDVNEIRTNVLNLPPYEGDEFNKPKGAQVPIPADTGGFF